MHRIAIRTWWPFLLAAGLTMLRPAQAQRPADPIPRPPRRPVAWENRRHDEVFTRLRLLQLPLPRKRPLPALEVIRAPAENRVGVPMILEEVATASAPDGDPDEDGRSLPETVLIAAKENVDALIFGAGRRADDPGIRGGMESDLVAKLFQLDRGRLLTADQVEKLRLAGRGDIERFFEEIDRRRREFEVVRWDLTQASEFLQSRVVPMRRALLNGPFGEGSLLRKTLAGFGPQALGPGARPRD